MLAYEYFNPYLSLNLFHAHNPPKTTMATIKRFFRQMRR